MAYVFLLFTLMMDMMEHDCILFLFLRFFLFFFLSLQKFFSLAHTRPSLSFHISFLSIIIMPGSLLLFFIFSLKIIQ
ncbi:hypothetical protein QBC37DRAFT_137568 [Rhypophila decipiens]|uniref:Uncharacterized protein n=1 Tax=Rhypophila decipiens TaxID=261697 RepID=A0AAN7BD37_9PEZI|nr:hypothetical protein QBC37DRAFT_137568 [Rhypophila decipiens]